LPVWQALFELLSKVCIAIDPLPEERPPSSAPRRWKPPFRLPRRGETRRPTALPYQNAPTGYSIAVTERGGLPAACIILNRQATKTCELRGMSSSRARRAGLFCRLACAAGNSKLSRRFPRAATTAPVPTAQLSGGAGANPLGRWVEVSGVHNLQDGKRD
jgi:hypothetical protein